MVRLAMLGVGGFGLFCLEQYRQMPGVEIAAIGGTNPAKYAALAEKYQIPFQTTDSHELVTHPGVDIVHLATPPFMRMEPALEAMAAGKHVFCEKPLALYLEEADAMLAAADRYGVRLGINFVMRYSELYESARTIVRDGLIGAAQHFAFENYAGDLKAGHWFWDPARGGGIPIEHGVHFFDIFGTIFGHGELRCALRTIRASGEEDKWLMALQYGPHVLGSFYHAFDKPSLVERTMSVLECERGRLLLEGWIPEKVTIDALVTDAEAACVTALLPGCRAEPLPGGETRVLANGQEVAVTHRLSGTASGGEKQAIYARAVRDAMADFIAWTQQEEYVPRVTGADGRAALAIAITARALAEA